MLKKKTKKVILLGRKYNMKIALNKITKDIKKLYDKIGNVKVFDLRDKEAKSFYNLHKAIGDFLEENKK